VTIAAQQAERRGAAATIRRGLGLSPELRRGLPATLVLALLATAGRVIVPVAVQQIIDGGFAEGGVDMGFVLAMTGWAFLAVMITAGSTGGMHLLWRGFPRLRCLGCGSGHSGTFTICRCCIKRLNSAACWWHESRRTSIRSAGSCSGAESC